MDEAPAPIKLGELSPQQRRDVVSLTAAGVASAAFFLIPLMGAGGQAQPLPASPKVTIAELAPATPATVPQLRTVIRASSTRRPAQLRRNVASPSLLLARATLSAQTPALSEIKRETRKPARGLVRALFGSGRYRVQPFPVP